jgi:peptidoglycan/LPS O-acetylase OafA/YrhL
MENGSPNSNPTIRLILIVWGLACLGAAYFIPQYDFGFDGVKVWFYICSMMLAIFLGGRWGITALKRH